ncbi:type-1 angiotensin II receptor B-like [Dreissena polymorpha]|uniref:type-1 angiotensin II receptor B-like n=1 Tax=Dreissena polymorpha TaxID=45954 RepID=UPI002264C56A|nr:type-1 angiotensin II receptor B-like [Dreissena polymorpha]
MPFPELLKKKLAKVKRLNQVTANILAPVIIIMFIFLFVGFFGNTFVVMMYRKRRQKTTAHVFIMFLAIIDWAACAIIHPYVIYKLFNSHDQTWVTTCKFFEVFIHFNLALSGLALLLIAIDRYLAICHPVKFLMFDKHVIKGITTITVIAFNNDDFEHLKRLQKSVNDAEAASKNHKDSKSSAFGNKSFKSRLKAAKILFCVTAVFFVSWLPFLFVRLATTINEDFWNDNSETTMVIRCFFDHLFYLNNAINPIIYTLINRKFRQESSVVSNSIAFKAAFLVRYDFTQASRVMKRVQNTIQA